MLYFKFWVVLNNDVLNLLFFGNIKVIVYGRVIIVWLMILWNRFLCVFVSVLNNIENNKVSLIVLMLFGLINGILLVFRIILL